MPRPLKCRRICAWPAGKGMAPLEGSAQGQIVMTADEYECIRLIDLAGYTQAECARQMTVARTTVQAIYDAARHKLADALVNGRRLAVSGGNVRTCPRAEGCCGRPCIKEEKEIGMKIAVTYENGSVYPHFGHCAQFKLYTVEEGRILTQEVRDTEGTGHGALAGWLKEQGVDTLICGGIGAGAREALAAADIRVYPGVSGLADEQVASLLAGTLRYDPDTLCRHHDGQGHHCGEHGCGH